jgi:hypothetical protein
MNLKIKVGFRKIGKPKTESSASLLGRGKFIGRQYVKEYDAIGIYRLVYCHR